MTSATYEFTDVAGVVGRSNFATVEEAALQAQADLASGRVVSVNVYDTGVLPEPIGRFDVPPITNTVLYDETTLPSEADLLTALGI
jgi:hypothetical protein